MSLRFWKRSLHWLANIRVRDELSHHLFWHIGFLTIKIKCWLLLACYVMLCLMLYQQSILNIHIIIMSVLISEETKYTKSDYKLLTLSCWSIFAPAFRSSITHSVCPFIALVCRGVHPSWGIIETWTYQQSILNIHIIVLCLY